MSYISKPPPTTKDQPNVPGGGNNSTSAASVGAATAAAPPQQQPQQVPSQPPNANNTHVPEPIPTPNLNPLFPAQVTPQQQLQAIQQAAYYMQMQQQMHGMAQGWSKESYQTIQRFATDEKNKQQAALSVQQQNFTTPPPPVPQNNTPSVTISKVPAQPVVQATAPQPATAANYQPSPPTSSSTVQGSTQNHTAPPQPSVTAPKSAETQPTAANNVVAPPSVTPQSIAPQAPQGPQTPQVQPLPPNPPPSNVTATVPAVSSNVTPPKPVTPQKVFDSSKASELRTLSPGSTFPPKPVSHLPTSTSLVQKTPTKSTLRLATVTPRIKLTPKKSPTGPPVKSPATSPAADRPNALIKQKELLPAAQKTVTATPNVPSKVSSASTTIAVKETPKPASVATTPAATTSVSSAVAGQQSDTAATVAKPTQPPATENKVAEKNSEPKPVEVKSDKKLNDAPKVTPQVKGKPVEAPKVSAESTKPAEKSKPVTEPTKAEQKPVEKKSSTIEPKSQQPKLSPDKDKKSSAPATEKTPSVKPPAKPVKVANDKIKPSPEKKEVKKSPPVKSTVSPNDKSVKKDDEPRPEIKLIIRKDVTKTSPKGETKSELKSELKSSPPAKTKTSPPSKVPAAATSIKPTTVKRESTVTPTSSSSSESSRSKRQRKGVQPFQSPIPEIENVKKISITQSTPKTPDPKLVLFYKNEFLAVRSAEGGFYLCQALQNVTKRGQKIKIRWLNEEKTGSQIYHFDYLDKTDFECVLTTVELLKTGKNHMKIPNHELERVKHILKNALDVEKGILPKPDLSEENPDGLDISIYTDESQLEKKASEKKRKKLDAAEDADSDIEPLAKKKVPVSTKVEPNKPNTKTATLVLEKIDAKTVGKKRPAEEKPATSAPPAKKPILEKPKPKVESNEKPKPTTKSKEPSKAPPKQPTTQTPTTTRSSRLRK